MFLMSERLMSDENSNVFVFMAGHSGPNFVKVQDWEEVTSADLADALNQMKVKLHQLETMKYVQNINTLRPFLLCHIGTR